MNKFQKEREQIFGERPFSKVQQQQVIEKLQKKNKPKTWLPALTVIAIAVIALFLVFNKTETPPVQQMTAASLEETYLQEFSPENPEVLYSKVPFVTENDGLLFVKVPFGDEEVILIKRGEFVQDSWVFTDAFSGATKSDLEHGLYWHTAKDKNVIIFSGVVADQKIDHVYIGDKKAEFVKIDAEARLWFGTANTVGAPVFYEADGVKIRIPSYELKEESFIPFVEAVGNEQIVHVQTNAMDRGDEQYSKFPVVIDPYYYAENRYASGDIILVNHEGKQDITRLITADQYDMSVVEGTILANGILQDSHYLWGNWNGDNTKYVPDVQRYGQVGRDEVFVMPDNWASNGVSGIINKMDIVGKVIGYSIMDIPKEWQAKDIALYEKFAKTKDDEVLRGVEPQQIVRVQLYANYMEDYETMYALYASDSKVRSYEDWIALNNFSKTPQIKQRILYEAYGTTYMQFYEDKSKLEWRDETNGKTKLAFTVERENGIWKVTYETVKYTY